MPLVIENDYDTIPINILMKSGKNPTKITQATMDNICECRKISSTGI